MKTFVALAALSMAVILTGFGYDVMFAGIPYQDPPPELHARRISHKEVSKTIMAVGAIGFAVVVVVALAVRIRRRISEA